MTMMPNSPFEDQAVSAFRAALFTAARRIDNVLLTHGFTGADSRSLKTIANKIAKSGVIGEAKGDTLLDKITQGMPVGILQRRTDFGKRRAESNLSSKAIIAGYFEGAPGFDAQKLVDRKPQSDEFLREASAHLDAIQSICEIIYEPYHELAQTEEMFYQKTNVYREFENREIGHFYGWQKTDDPFALKVEDPRVAVELAAQAPAM